jgi:hypothetical protein
MGADAPLVAVVIGSAVFLLCALAVVVAFTQALRHRAEFEGEIKARPLTFRLKVTPPGTNRTAKESPEDARGRTRDERRK